MKIKVLIISILLAGFCSAQDFWERTNFPSDNSSLFSIYSMITNSSDHILIGTFAKGIFKSTDQGLSWSESGLSNQWIISFSKDNTGNIYTASIGSQFGSGVYKSNDEGTTWDKMWDAETGMNCVYVDQNNHVYVGLNYSPSQSGIYASNDGGGNWQKIFDEAVNIYAITKLSSGRLLAASYGKVFYSDDNGSLWSSTSNGLVSSTPSMFAIRNQTEIFMSTLGYGIYKSTDNGVNWTNKTGAGPDYSCIIVNTDGSMHAGTKGSWVYRSVDGNNWGIVNSGMGDDKYVLSLLTTNAGYLFAGMDYAGLYKSADKIVTNVETNNETPIEFSLQQNYPNPFNPSTTIEFVIPQSDEVTLIVYDMLGREVAELLNGKLSAGNYKVQYNAAEKVSSGVYIYRLRTKNYSNTKKLLLIK